VLLLVWGTSVKKIGDTIITVEYIKDRICGPKHPTVALCCKLILLRYIYMVYSHIRSVFGEENRGPRIRY